MIRYEHRANSDIRRMIRESGIPQYEIAHRCGVDEGSLCRWLRYELSADDDRRRRILEAINKGGQENENV